MGDSDDDSPYPPKHFSSSSYNASLRSRRPNRNPTFQSYREEEDMDENNGYEDEELEDQNDGGNREFGNQDDDDEEEEEGDDDEDEYLQNGYGGRRGYEGGGANEDAKRRQKKRRLESLVSQFEFAPRVSVNVQKSGFGGGRDSSVEWTEKASFVLLEVWGDRFLELGRRSLRTEDWIEVAEKVSEMCKVERTHVQCRNRLDTLKKKYKKERAKMEEMGAYYGKWVFFKKMDMLLNVSNRQQSGLACGVDSGEYVFMNPKVYLSRSNALDEMMDSPGESDSDGGDSDGLPPPNGRGEDDDGSSFKLLAESIQKFGAIYEKIEDSKRQQMLDLERMRMEFQTDLELQKKQILERAQVEIAKIRQGDKNDDEDDDATDTDESAVNVSG